MKDHIFMKRFIAPRVLMVNGKRSPCLCDDNTVCGYCVQANLVLFNRMEKGNDVVAAAIATIRKVGVRKTARTIGEYENTVRRWIKSGNVPVNAIEKVAKLRE